MWEQYHGGLVSKNSEEPQDSGANHWRNQGIGEIRRAVTRHQGESGDSRVDSTRGDTCTGRRAGARGGRVGRLRLGPHGGNKGLFVEGVGEMNQLKGGRRAVPQLSLAHRQD